MTVQTIDLKGNKYALVPQRLKEFRSKNPRSLVETKPTIDGNMLIFEARIVTDKSDASSAEATGHSYGELKGDKAFEKLETVAVGRALALLGYLNNGQIATTEEMQEFEAYKATQLEAVIEKIKVAKTKDEFKDLITGLTPEQKREVTPIINERIKELKDGQDK